MSVERKRIAKTRLLPLGQASVLDSERGCRRDARASVQGALENSYRTAALQSFSARSVYVIKHTPYRRYVSVVVVGTYELSIRKTSYNKKLCFNCNRPADYILANYLTNNNKHINNYTERDIHSPNRIYFKSQYDLHKFGMTVGGPS